MSSWWPEASCSSSHFIGTAFDERIGNAGDGVPYGFYSPAPTGGGKIPSPGERVAPKGSGEECGRKPKSLYRITDLFRGWKSYLAAGLWVPGHPMLPPAFLFSHQSVPKSRLATASPRGKRFCASRQTDQRVGPTTRIPYAERILATGRAVLLDYRHAKPISHEFVTRHCREKQPCPVARAGLSLLG